MLKLWLKRTVWAVMVSVTLTTFWLVGKREWHRRGGERDHAAAAAEADAQDPAWRWDALNAARTRPPADRNAAAVVPRVKALTAPDWGKTRLVGQTGPFPDPPPNVRYPAAVVADARRDLLSSAEAVGLARTLQDLPDGHRDVVLAANPVGTILDDTQSTRHAADLLRWDAVAAAEDDDFARAGEAVRAALNASRSVGDEPLMLSQLVRIGTRAVAVRAAERAVAQADTRVRAGELRPREMRVAFAADADAPLLRYGLRGDRAMFDVVYERLQDGTLDQPERVARGVAPVPDGGGFDAGWWLYRGRLPADRAFALGWMTRAVEVAGRPVHEQPAGFAELPAAPDDKSHVLSRSLLSGSAQFAAASWRSVADARCAAAGLACEEFRLKHGRWPDTLTELSPDILAAVPLDPADGAPLRYRKLADGVLVYSAGVPEPPPVGTPVVVLPRRLTTGRPGLPADVAVGFRLWDPEARRQPPPPEPKPDDEKRP